MTPLPQFDELGVVEPTPSVTIVEELARHLPPGVGAVDAGKAIETIRISPLDKHAHLRRAVEDIHADQQRIRQALNVHQGVLQTHAELHGSQFAARVELKKLLETRIDNAFSVVNRGITTETEPLTRDFLGRLRWLFLGR